MSSETVSIDIKHVQKYHYGALFSGIFLLIIGIWTSIFFYTEEVQQKILSLNINLEDILNNENFQYFSLSILIVGGAIYLIFQFTREIILVKKGDLKLEFTDKGIICSTAILEGKTKYKLINSNSAKLVLEWKNINKVRVDPAGYYRNEIPAYYVVIDNNKNEFFIKRYLFGEHDKQIVEFFIKKVGKDNVEINDELYRT